MLFDLRSRGRRRTVQVVYLGLALILGGGLILFGVGAGNGIGGLLNAFTGNGSGNSQSQAISQQEKNALKQIKLNPNDAAAWGDAGQRPLGRRRHRQQLQQQHRCLQHRRQAGAGGDHRRLAALRVADQEARSQPRPARGPRVRQPRQLLRRGRRLGDRVRGRPELGARLRVPRGVRLRRQADPQGRSGARQGAHADAQAQPRDAQVTGPGGQDDADDRSVLLTRPPVAGPPGNIASVTGR